jgi:hypothetical protein
MVLASSLKSEDELMICFIRFNTGGLDESSPYINIDGHDKSNPYIKKKMGMINQAHTELIIIPGGIKG